MIVRFRRNPEAVLFPGEASCRTFKQDNKPISWRLKLDLEIRTVGEVDAAVREKATSSSQVAGTVGGEVGRITATVGDGRIMDTEDGEPILGILEVGAGRIAGGSEEICTTKERPCFRALFLFLHRCESAFLTPPSDGKISSAIGGISICCNQVDVIA